MRVCSVYCAYVLLCMLECVYGPVDLFVVNGVLLVGPVFSGIGPRVSEKCSIKFSIMNRHPHTLKAAWVIAITTQHSS